ncbi:MAG: hypothetical protein QM489_03985 [Candidatus Izemoplasma sp.]
MGTIDSQLNYIEYFEQMVGSNHPSLETTLNRGLKNLATLLDTGAADTQVRRLNIKITNATDIGASVVENDVVYLNDATGKYEPAFDDRAIGIIDIENLMIYISGVYVFKTLSTLTINERYYIDKTNPGKLVISTDANASSTSIGMAIDIDTIVIELRNSKYLQQHIDDLSNPHNVTKEQVGLGNVDNTSDATKNSAVATLTNKTLESPVINTPTGLTKDDVGLSNVDNTSDLDKPISNAVASVLNTITTGFRHVYISDDYQSQSGDDLSVDTSIAIAQVDKVDNFVLADSTDYTVTINGNDYVYTSATPVAQVNKITIVEAVDGDVYAIKVDGVVYSYTADATDTVATIADGLAAGISNGVSDGVDSITITAETPGVPQTVAVDGTTTTITNISETPITANVSSDTTADIIDGLVSVIIDNDVEATNDSDIALLLTAKIAGVPFDATVDIALMSIVNVTPNKDRPVNVTLPASPIENSNVQFLDAKGTFDLYNLNILRNGKTIMGLEEDMVVDSKNASFALVYTDNDWRIK